MSKKELPLLYRATEIAFSAHKRQSREGSGIPYVNHLCEVTSRVANYMWDVTEKDIEMTKDEILAASMLHDYIEDCNVSLETVSDKFGVNVANVVLQCSRDSGKKTKKEKYEFLESFHDKSVAAILIKVADRYCNVCDYYRFPGKEKYASTYALQAYPLYQAFRKERERTNNVHNWNLIQDDINSLQKISSKVYNVQLFDTLQNDFVKELVT